ncbi:MAG: hypothetical protein AAFU60_06360 [Bacteroidota bacterium]
MKRRFWYISIGLLLTLGSTVLIAQSKADPKPKPDKVQGIAKERKPASYYAEQSKLWQEMIAEDPEDAEAWRYYYVAERAKLQLEQPDLWANDQPVFYQTLDPILQRASKQIKTSFEYPYLQGMNTSGEAAIAFFEEAYNRDPDRPEVHDWLFSYYVPRFMEKECKDLATRLLSSNLFSDASMKWNYNALVSTEPNSIIISNGDMDGIPKWILQYGAQVRTDVIVANKWLLADLDSYRERIYQQIGLSAAAKSRSDFSTLGAYADYLAVDVMRRSERSTYISSGTNYKFFENNQLGDKVFVVGNVLKYSAKPFDNLAVLEENIQDNYYLEHILQSFQHHQEDEMVRTSMHLTYLPGLFLLQEEYQKQNDAKQLAYINRLIDQILEDSGRREEVIKWFK